MLSSGFIPRSTRLDERKPSKVPPPQKRLVQQKTNSKGNPVRVGIIRVDGNASVAARGDGLSAGRNERFDSGVVFENFLHRLQQFVIAEWLGDESPDATVEVFRK